jgi:serine protease Do
MKSRLIPVVLTAALTSVLTIFVAGKYQDHLPFAATEAKLPVNYASFNTSGAVMAAPPADFENAAEASVEAAVHIKTQTKSRTIDAQDLYGNDFFGNLFGGNQRFYIPPQMGSGSGVVISPDGYIVTNYHVVSNTEKVTVTFNDRLTAEATVVGKDPSTDIAVLKVNEKNLPYMEFGNSDDVKLGQWVLAVGYPLTLDATVTAGIVSAKSRAIGINKTQSSKAIESFIQTDAAVNPGNSGGALVNTKGQLIGINSAIASPTGSYAGYSYAIPANIVKKAVNDLMQYGSVQRAYLGIGLIDPSQLSALGLEREDGVYVASVPENGAAFKSGLKKGDFITSINGVAIRSEPQLLEQVARYKPGDNVSVIYRRAGKDLTTTVELKNAKGNTSVIKTADGINLLGAEFRPLSQQEKASLGVKSGVLVTDIQSGAIASQTNMKKGFVITSINDQPVSDESAVQEIVSGSNKAQIAGFYPGKRGMFYYGISNLDDPENTEQ